MRRGLAVPTAMPNSPATSQFAHNENCSPGAHTSSHRGIPGNKNSRDITARQAQRWDKQICPRGELSEIKSPIFFKVNTPPKFSPSISMTYACLHLKIFQTLKPHAALADSSAPLAPRISLHQLRRQPAARFETRPHCASPELLPGFPTPHNNVSGLSGILVRVRDLRRLSRVSENNLDDPHDQFFQRHNHE